MDLGMILLVVVTVNVTIAGARGRVDGTLPLLETTWGDLGSICPGDGDVVSMS
jgi:hypothetical protein